MAIQTVSVIGLGALGTMYAQRLTAALPQGQARVIANDERSKRYTQQGVFCNGEACNFTYIAPGANLPPADLVIFATKYPHLSQAIQDARSQIGPNTILLSVLNGIVSEQDLCRAFGPQNVLYCVAQGMDATKTGNQLKYKAFGMLCFGEKDGQPGPNAKAVAAFFDATGTPYQLRTDMQRHLWSKFMLNVGVNQTAAVYGTHYRGLQQPGEEHELMLAAMREVLVLSQKEGVTLTDADIEYWMPILNALNPKGTPSMRQDIDARRPTEVDLFAGTVLALGKKHGVPTPVNQQLYNRIREIESTFTD